MATDRTISTRSLQSVSAVGRPPPPPTIDNISNATIGRSNDPRTLSEHRLHESTSDDVLNGPGIAFWRGDGVFPREGTYAESESGIGADESVY